MFWKTKPYLLVTPGVGSKLGYPPLGHQQGGTRLDACRDLQVHRAVNCWYLRDGVYASLHNPTDAPTTSPRFLISGIYVSILYVVHSSPGMNFCDLDDRVLHHMFRTTVRLNSLVSGFAKLAWGRKQDRRSYIRSYQWKAGTF